MWKAIHAIMKRKSVNNEVVIENMINMMSEDLEAHWCYLFIAILNGPQLLFQPR